MSETLDQKLDPRVKRTHSLILQAFNSLLNEKNFKTITVQDVTARAQINRATFYAHFADKYALLDFSVQEMFRSELEQRSLNVCSYSHENLRNLILAVCEFLVKLNTGCAQPHQQFDSLVEEPLKRQIFDLLSHWLRDAKVPVEIPATVATWAIYGLGSYYSHTKKRPILETFVDDALPLVAVNLESIA